MGFPSCFRLILIRIFSLFPFPGDPLDIHQSVTLGATAASCRKVSCSRSEAECGSGSLGEMASRIFRPLRRQNSTCNVGTYKVWSE